MKAWKKIGMLLLVTALLLAHAPCASAEADLDDARFAHKTWQEVIEDFLDEHGANPAKVACGWCNTVTGEEQYFNGDQYMTSGSMYKVPMNMIFAEKVHNGEISWDSFVGGYRPYRPLLAPYMGEDPDTVDEKFYENNFSTPRQNIYALKLLATESERFPRVIDKMLEAEPHKYFKAHEHTVDIAHKYGYFTEGAHLYLNDCAIVYTEEPMCIVLFTDTVVEPYKLLADYCDLMIDYTEYSTAARREAERIAAEEAAIAALNSPTPAPEETAHPAAPGTDTPAPAVTAPQPSAAPAAEKDAAGVFGRIVLLVLIAAAALCFAVAALRAAQRKKLRPGRALCAILLAAAALGVCLLPQRTAAQPEKEETVELQGDPQAAVSAFFDALEECDYARACEKLAGVSSLGLEYAPETEDAAAIWRAMEENREYRLYGECRAVSGGAVQQIVYTTLDLRALGEAVKAATEAKVERLAAELPQSEIYDDEGGYLDSFTERAYREALEETLGHAADYRTTVGLNVRLVRSGKDWLIEPDATLYGALTGGAVK